MYLSSAPDMGHFLPSWSALIRRHQIFLAVRNGFFNKFQIYLTYMIFHTSAVDVIKVMLMINDRESNIEEVYAKEIDNFMQYNS